MIAASLVLGIYLWVQSYLKSEGFRNHLTTAVCHQLQVDGAFDGIHWNDSTLVSNRFEAKGRSDAASLQKLRADSIRGTVRFGSFRKEAWDVPLIEIRHLNLSARLGTPGIQGRTRTIDVGSPRKTWWKKWLPSRVDIGEIRIEDARFDFAGPFALNGNQIKAVVKPMRGDGWSVRCWRGDVQFGKLPPASVEELHFTTGKDGLYVNDALFGTRDGARITMTGQFGPNRSLSVQAGFKKLPADKIVAPDWKQRLKGEFEGNLDFRRESSDEHLVQNGAIRLRNGVLQALPVLDRIAAYTNTDRFRRLVLHRADARYTVRPDHVQISEIYLESKGLLRITGRLRIERDSARPWVECPIDGSFRVGVVRETLKWLPGAEQKVFSSPRDGFAWTTMKIGGTVGDPVEDLTPRLKEAAVDTAVEELVELPERVLEQGVDVLGKPGDLIDKGSDILQKGLKFVPFLGE